MQKRWMGVLLVLALGQVVPQAQAASFDCGNSSTKVEKVICADQELSKLDEELSAAYHEALGHARLAGADEIRQEQRYWLKEDRNRCKDADCLKRAYRQRLGRIDVLMGVERGESIEATAGEACLAPKIDWRNYAWTLITGKGMAACEEMLAWLQSRPQDAPPPVCPEDRLPRNVGWSRPAVRILSEAEKQALIAGIPEKWRQIPNGPVSYERKFKEAALMRVIRTDITHDGIPETFLAYGPDHRKTCKRATRCATANEVYGNQILVSVGYGDSNYYELLPMNEEGTQVDWSLGIIGPTPLLWIGELVSFKGRPYWMTMVTWDQGANDEPTHSRRTDYPYNDTFGLYEISAGNSKLSKGIGGVGLYNDPKDHVNPGCRFGYFNRETLKQQRKGR